MNTIISNKKVLELSKTDDTMKRKARIRKLYEKDVKFIDINKINFTNTCRMHPRANTNVFSFNTLENDIFKVLESDFYKELKNITDIQIKLRATRGSGFYNNKNRNEILTDCVTLLITKNKKYILCDKQTKGILIQRVQQQDNYITTFTEGVNIDKELETYKRYTDMIAFMSYQYKVTNVLNILC